MFHLDTLRLIRKSFNRFFSLVMIVMIGVAFMMGLLSTPIIMEDSVDVYNDKYHMQDLQVFSSYGFDENDIRAIEAQEYVERCFASKMIDVFSRDENDNTFVARVEETRRDVNQFDLYEGKMPENASEVIVLNGSADSGYQVGDRLTLFLDDDDIGKYLKKSEVEIVGLARTPTYLSKMLGTSTLKNLDLEIVLYTLPSAFLREYYTTVYIVLADTEGLNGFSDEYKEYVSDKKTDFSVFANKQQNQLKDKLVEEYTEEIQSNEAKLEEKKSEAQLQLDEAQQKLEEANIQIIANQAQLDSLNTVLRKARERLSSLQTQYSSKYGDVEARVNSVQNQYGGRPFEEIYSELLTDYGTYTALKSIKNGTSTDVYEDRINEVQADTDARRARLNGSLYPRRDELETILADPENSEEVRENAREELNQINLDITSEEQQIEINDRLISGYRELQAAQSSGSAEEMMRSIDAKYGGSVEKTYREMTSLAQDRIAWEAIKTEMQLAQEAVNEASGEISLTQAQLDTGKVQYEAGVKEYQEQLLLFNEEIEKAEAEIRKAYQDLEELPGASWMLLDRDSQYSSYMYSNNSKQMGAIGVALPILFYLVAALVCMTTMTRLIDEQRGQIGVFRALGFSKGAVIGKYVLYALLACLIGSTIGIFVGMALFPTVIYNTWRLMYYLPPMIMQFPLKNVAICYLAFSLLIAVVTAIVANSTLREVPSQLMRPKAPKNARKVFLENIPFLWKRLSFTGKITARNLIRYKVRFFMTVIGVAGCTSLLVVGWGIKDSIKDVVAIQFGDLYNYNFTVNLENDHALSEITDALRSDLNNEFVTPIMSYSSKIYLEDEEKVLQVQVMDAREGNDVLHLRSLDHSTPVRISNNGALLSEKFAKTNGIHKGDYITIESRNGIKAQVKVSEIVEMYFQHYLYISTDYYNSLFDEPFHPDFIAVESTLTAEEMEVLVKDIEGFESITDFTSVTEQFNTMIQALDLIIVVIIVTAGALAFVVLVNLTQVNISERIREIATLKVLGFREREVESYFFKEIFLLTVIGALVGQPLGILE
ncbi:MAG: FtsX-like permease family protein, partial [Oscillospiraceae bacterium]|nr:FtsX-like permease family protein [Oscillospiraceae bacterium]